MYETEIFVSKKYLIVLDHWAVHDWAKSNAATEVNPLEVGILFSCNENIFGSLKYYPRKIANDFQRNQNYSGTY